MKACGNPLLKITYKIFLRIELFNKIENFVHFVFPSLTLKFIIPIRTFNAYISHHLQYSFTGEKINWILLVFINCKYLKSFDNSKIFPK